MDTKLHFVITKVNGDVEEQDITVPVDKVNEAIQQMLGQYAQVGMLRKQEDRFTLLPASQIALVECEFSKLVLATENETDRVAQAAAAIGKLKRIT